ncbi:PilW family protein [Luteimonas huabeiensis]|uniref:PilW family protein n=1 Tax=Luteimonas huabeiensis TaxID=1244513 RepID=UPI0004648141|nr:PilW family protein [Luteimonas huabeiensis]
MSRGARARGVSLIELLIALLIGSLLVLGLVQIFSASRTAYQLSEGMSRVQENARFALDFLQRDIRLAGHFGCVNDQAHWVKDPVEGLGVHLGTGLALAHPLNFAVSIQGYEAAGTAPGNTLSIGAATPAWYPTLPAQISTLVPSPVAGSDILVLRYLGARGAPVTAISGAAGAEILTFSATGWPGLTEDGVTSPTLFGIADCSYATVFPGTGTSGQVAVSSALVSPATGLVGRYTAHPSGQTLLYRANSLVYYVALNPNGEPALYRARATSTGGYDVPEELVEGVESLQLLFGQDTTPQIATATPPVGNITFHNTASTLLAGATTAEQQANQWRRVGQVQVGLLMRSPARAAAPEIAHEDNNLRVLGTVYQSPATHDGRFRSSYESTVALRNRLFGN